MVTCSKPRSKQTCKNANKHNTPHCNRSSVHYHPRLAAFNSRQWLGRFRPTRLMRCKCSVSRLTLPCLKLNKTCPVNYRKTPRSMSTSNTSSSAAHRRGGPSVVMLLLTFTAVDRDVSVIQEIFSARWGVCISRVHVSCQTDILTFWNRGIRCQSILINVFRGERWWCLFKAWRAAQFCHEVARPFSGRAIVS